ncbi:hypothetical protein [Paenibacillus sp. YYML68]|nr:hypothetical protein [Paenibacillus sp. YYML68]
MIRTIAMKLPFTVKRHHHSFGPFPDERRELPYSYHIEERNHQ